MIAYSGKKIKKMREIIITQSQEEKRLFKTFIKEKFWAVIAI